MTGPDVASWQSETLADLEACEERSMEVHVPASLLHLASHLEDLLVDEGYDVGWYDHESMVVSRWHDPADPLI